MISTRAISKKIKARCPHCNGTLDMREFGDELFRQIVDALKAGEEVDARGFGQFRFFTVKGRTIDVGGGKEIKFDDRIIIKYRISPTLRIRLNEKEETK